MKPRIKLIIVDFYGVMTLGSYKDTCRFLAKKYRKNYPYLYKIIYHKYFNAAALGKISEQESFDLAVKELGLSLTGKQLRAKHMSFQKLNQLVFNLMLNLQNQGYKILLLSKNTPPQLEYTLKRFKIRKFFNNVINTFDLRLPKASVEAIKLVLKKFRVKPEEVIMIDDQGFNLIQAQKIGVATIHYKNFKKLETKLKKLI